jgi:hypothetical protein
MAMMARLWSGDMPSRSLLARVSNRFSGDRRDKCENNARQETGIFSINLFKFSAGTFQLDKLLFRDSRSHPGKGNFENC